MLKDAHKVFFRGASLWQRRTSALSTRLIFGTFRVQRRTTAFVQQDGYFGSFVFKDVQDVKYKTDILDVLRSKTYNSFVAGYILYNCTHDTQPACGPARAFTLS